MKNMDWTRARSLTNGTRSVKGEGPVVYWMSRDQRVHDNWALVATLELAKKYQRETRVIFSLTPTFPGATMRTYDFLLRGLEEVEVELARLGIGFTVLLGEPSVVVKEYIDEHRVAILITDFDPLQIKRSWKQKVIVQTDVEMLEVDAHNIIPCWVASPKLEFGAYTIRPKIHARLPQYLVEFPRLPKKETPVLPVTDWKKIREGLHADTSVTSVDWIIPGEKHAKKALKQFINERLAGYEAKRNDPNTDAQSGLSPYLHFGHLSAQRIALDALSAKVPFADREAYLEELIVRRELSDNYCYYNPNYATYEGFPEWAKKSLAEHEGDKREYLYTKEQFEYAKTHDPLWNAAQKQMMTTGKMHGYMRMYWAKKILEWSNNAKEAMDIAVYLNDRYELDGRDPNGYVGCAWSIGGVHDRAWFDRPVYGKVRYMNDRGCAKKFDTGAYVAGQTELST